MSSDEDTRAITEAWEFIQTRAHGRVRAVAQRAAQEPTLRALYPFQSLNWLRFSRATSYPYDFLPYVSAEGTTDFEARDAENRVLARGNLETVIAAVVKAIDQLP